MLKNDFEEDVADSESKYEKIKELENVIENLHVKLTEKYSVDSKLETLSAKFDSISSENKAFKTENIEQKTELKKVNIKLKQKEDAYIETAAFNEDLIDELKAVNAEKEKTLRLLEVKTGKSSH